MIKIIYSILFINILSNISYAQDEKYYYYKLEKLEKNNYELSSKINYLEKKLDNFEKTQRELIKENIILKKDIQKELEKQQIIIRNLDEHSNKNINNSIETINDFNKELKLSQTINFTTLGMFLIVIISLIIYISISIKRITKEALDKENNKQVKEKVFEFNKELQKTMNSVLSDIEINNNQLSFKTLEDKALEFFKTGKYQESIDTYKKAISINKSNTDIYIALAHVYNHIGDYNLAIEIYDTAISFKPNSAELYNQKAITFMQLGDYNSSLLSIENSIKIDPENYHYYNTKGIIYYSKKEYKKSIEMFNKSIELNQKFANAYHNRATSYLAINENDLAVKDFSKAIEFEGGLLKTGR